MPFRQFLIDGFAVHGLSAALLVAFAGAALWTDARTWRIPNKLNAAAAAAGLGVHTVLDGWRGALFSLAGLAIGLAATLVLYACRAVGAGDVKCFAAIGALGGWQLSVNALIYAIVIGGLIGIAIVVSRRMFSALAVRLRTALISTLLLRVWPVHGAEAASKLTRFPFMYAVFPAVLASLWIPLG